MRAIVAVAACACGVLFVAAGASAQEFRWVTGKVAAWTNDSVIVWVPGADLNATFVLDDETLVLPPERNGVREWPSPQWRLRQSFPVDAAVEVHYVRQPTRNYAGIIRAPWPGRRLAAGTSIAGVVTSVSDNEIGVRADEKEETFAVEAWTRVDAAGPPPARGTGPRPGERAKLTDYVAMQDMVLVFYRADDKRPAAIEIAVLRKHK